MAPACCELSRLAAEGSPPYLSPSGRKQRLGTEQLVGQRRLAPLCPRALHAARRQVEPRGRQHLDPEGVEQRAGVLVERGREHLRASRPGGSRAASAAGSGPRSRSARRPTRAGARRRPRRRGRPSRRRPRGRRRRCPPISGARRRPWTSPACRTSWRATSRTRAAPPAAMCFVN